MKPRRLRHRLEHGLLVSAGALVVRIPESWAIGLGNLVGWIAGSLLRIRRSVVESNLALAFPERTERWRQKVARSTYRHFGREAVSLLRFQRMDPHEIRERCEVEDFHLVTGPIEQGQGVIVLLGHFGSWEIAGVSATARGVPVSAVAREQANPLVDEYMKDARRRLRMGEVLPRSATRQMMKALGQARALALVADQNVARDGVFVDFFGAPAATARGPGVLAARTGSPVVFVDPRRQEAPTARYRVSFSPVTHDPAPDPEENVRLLTQAYMACLERVVRESPEQYFWFHRRWKTRPEAKTKASRGSDD